MSEDEISNILDELNKVRPEVLNEESKRLFEAIMKIADDRDKYIDLYEKEKEKNIELQNYTKEYLIPKSTINLIYINKDKIKEKIKEVKQLENVSISDIVESEKEFCIDILNELLEETNE